MKSMKLVIIIAMLIMAVMMTDRSPHKAGRKPFERLEIGKGTSSVSRSRDSFRTITYLNIRLTPWYLCVTSNPIS